MTINTMDVKIFIKKNAKYIAAAAVVAVIGAIWYWQSGQKTGLNPLGGSQKVAETQVIKYNPPDELPETVKEGLCWATSIAQPYRTDAWRCQLTPENPEAEGVSANEIFDPCFSIASKDTVVCGIDPIANTVAFELLQSQPLPEPQPASPLKENWGWLVELADGTLCAPFTGTVPVINGQAAPYGCKSNIEGQNVVLLADLNKGTVWTASEGEIVIENNAVTVKSQKEVQVKTVWQ